MHGYGRITDLLSQAYISIGVVLVPQNHFSLVLVLVLHSEIILVSSY